MKLFALPEHLRDDAIVGFVADNTGVLRSIVLDADLSVVQDHELSGFEDMIRPPQRTWVLRVRRHMCDLSRGAFTYVNPDGRITGAPFLAVLDMGDHWATIPAMWPVDHSEFEAHEFTIATKDR